MKRTLLLVALAALVACGDGTTPPPRPPIQAPPSRPADYAGDWGRFHSKRFLLSVQLPDGKNWKIDDHTRPELVATHAPTTSRLAIEVSRQEGLMNRAKCEMRAREGGHVPTGHLTTVEDQVTIGPDAFDSRVWVVLDAGRQGGELEGHVFLFGAFIHTCLLVHLSTRVSAGAEDVLSSRLAIARERIVAKIAIDPPRVSEDATVPKEKR